MISQTKNYSFNTIQTSILTKSLTIAGLFFLLIGAIAIGFSQIFLTNMEVFANIGLPLFLVLIFMNIFISIMWMRTLWKNNHNWLIGIIYFIYISTMGISFGYIFALVRLILNFESIIASFLIVGVVTSLAGLICKLMNKKTAIAFTKIILYIFIAMLITMFMLLILMIVSLTNTKINAFIDWLDLLIMAGIAIVSFLYLVLDMWSIKKTSEFASLENNNELPKKYLWFFSYKLLTDLLNILLIAILYILKFSSRRA